MTIDNHGSKGGIPLNPGRSMPDGQSPDGLRNERTTTLVPTLGKKPKSAVFTEMKQNANNAAFTKRTKLTEKNVFHALTKERLDDMRTRTHARALDDSAESTSNTERTKLAEENRLGATRTSKDCGKRIETFTLDPDDFRN